jgi:outer membrane protein assembly factor BamB
LVGGVVAAILAVTAATAWPRAEDNPGAAGAAGAASPSADPAPAASLVWQMPTGHPATGPPAVAADRVFVGGSDGVIRAFSSADGHLDWSLRTGDKQVTVAAQVMNNVVYASTADGIILAVDAGTGEEQWRRATGSEFDARPVVAGDRIYAGGRDAVLYAYELGGNHRRWRVWTGAAIHSSPAAVGDIVTVASGDGRLYGVDHAGGIVWKTPVGQVTGDLAAAGDAACFALDDGSVRCATATDGTLLSRITLPGTDLSSSAGGVYAAAADRTVAAWDTRTGMLRWQYRPTGGDPAAGYLALRDGELTVTYPDGRLAGIDAGSGAERWAVAVDDQFDAAAGGTGSSMFAVGKTGILYDLKVPAAPTVRPAQPSSASATPTPTPTTRPPRTHVTTRPTYRPKSSPAKTHKSTTPTPSSVAPTTTTPTPLPTPT